MFLIFCSNARYICMEHIPLFISYEWAWKGHILCKQLVSSHLIESYDSHMTILLCLTSFALNSCDSQFQPIVHIFLVAGYTIRNPWKIIGTRNFHTQSRCYYFKATSVVHPSIIMAIILSYP